MSTTTDNGKAQAEKVITLPATLEVVVNGTTITADATVSGKDNIWYPASLEGELAEGADLVAALLATTATYQGEVLLPGKRNRSKADGSTVIAISEPRKYDKKHPKAGENVPNTGGNPVISFVKPLPNFGESGVAYQLRVTCTGIEDDGRKFIAVSVACQTALKGKERRIVGRSNGPVVFGG